MTTICIYHSHCIDGFGAAWAVHRALGDREVEYFPGVHQMPPPDVTGQRVILVDFSYKRPVLLEMASQAESILILDHHLSARDDLVDLPSNVTAHFDLDHSGAILAWQHYFPDQPPPMLLRHIQDRDLWRFELEGTNEIQSALYSYPYDFALWDRFVTDPQALAKLREDGKALQRKQFKDIQQLIASGARRMKIAGYSVPVLNAPSAYSSDAGNILAKGEPFAACYWDGKEGRNFSLRSSADGLDVSRVAVGFGGGGHPRGPSQHGRPCRNRVGRPWCDGER